MLTEMTYFGRCYLVDNIFAQLLDRFRTSWFVLDLHLVPISLFLVVLREHIVKSSQLTPGIHAGERH